MRVPELPSAHPVEHDNLDAHAGEGTHDLIKIACKRSVRLLRLDEESTPRRGYGCAIDAVGRHDHANARGTLLHLRDGP